jgi:hypothetical protein
VSEGLHQVAVARTDDEAREQRDEIDRRTASAPNEARAAWRTLLEAPPAPDRAAMLKRAYTRAYAAFARRDWELNTLTHHPTDYLFRTGDFRQLLPDVADVYRGPGGYIEAMELWLAAWAEVEVEVEVEDVLDTGGSRTVALNTVHLRGGASGVDIVQPMADLHTWRDGWMVEQQYWWDRAAALRAAGLSPR